ncbi:AMP-binding enzyme [Cupriavidus basilensis]
MRSGRGAALGAAVGGGNLFAPDVLEAAVVAAPDEKSGEVPYAYIALKAFANSTAEQVLAQSADFIPERAAIPKACYVLPTLPKTAVGKVQKNVLPCRCCRARHASCTRTRGAFCGCSPAGRGQGCIRDCVRGRGALMLCRVKSLRRRARPFAPCSECSQSSSWILPASARKKSPRN